MEPTRQALLQIMSSHKSSAVNMGVMHVTVNIAGGLCLSPVARGVLPLRKLGDASEGYSYF